MELVPEHRQRLDQYERRTSIPMIALALFFLGLYAAPVLKPTLSTRVLNTISVLDVVIWLAFVVDLAARAYLSGKPGPYLARHPIDVILVALPMLRPLRVLRVFTATNFMVSRGGRFAVGKTMTAAFSATALLMIIAALAMTDVERHATGANIKSFGTALWWAGATVTTVGYGDTYPVTVEGRLVAFALMLVGISLLGLITASVAAWFVARTREVEDEVMTELRAIRTEVAELRTALASVDERTATPRLGSQ